VSRIFLKFFAAILVALLVFAAAAAAVFWAVAEPKWPRGEQVASLVGELAAEILGAQAAVPAQAQQVLERWHSRAQIDLALFDAAGAPVAQVGRALPVPGPGRDLGWVGPGRDGPPRFIALLPSGARLVMHRSPGAEGRGSGGWRPGFGAAMLLLALAVAAGAYPVVRRLTHRIERLQKAVDAMGRGDLTQRVEVSGRDEVARLATSFNDSAQRIQALVQAQRDLLAHTSHELRSPLARLKLALELQRLQPRDERHLEIDRNIAELDELIESLLLASRLDALGPGSLQISALPVALHDIIDRELDALQSANPKVEILERPRAEVLLQHADPVLLRRMVRNLLENAALHGASSDGTVRVSVQVSKLPGQVMMTVCDQGPGIAPPDRQRIFEAFERSSTKAQGTGLGLALVRGIARAHQGNIRYVPMPAGSCFEVTLKA
jgi:signal transduction histidine kinase